MNARCMRRLWEEYSKPLVKMIVIKMETMFLLSMDVLRQEDNFSLQLANVLPVDNVIWSGLNVLFFRVS